MLQLSSGQEKMAINLDSIPEIQREQLCRQAPCVTKTCLLDFIKPHQ